MLAAAAAVYLGLSEIYTHIWTKNLEADVRFSTDSAVCGDEIEIVEVISNDKWLPLPFVNVKFQMDRKLEFEGEDSNSSVTDKSYKNDVFSLLFHQRITRRLPVRCRRRGVYCIDSIELVSKGIFMNQVMSCQKYMHRELIVYPKIADVNGIDVLSRNVLGDIITRRAMYEDPFEIRGIRDYTTYDSMKMINWKATARTLGLKVNIHDYTSSRKVCIIMNLKPDGMIINEALQEESISIVAGLVQRLSAQGVVTGIVSNGRDRVTGTELIVDGAQGLAHIKTVNTCLARIDLNLDMEPVENLFDRIDEQSVCIMVSPGTNKALQSGYNDMCRQGKAVSWILPYHDGMDTGLQFCPDVSVTPWEVARYE